MQTNTRPSELRSRRYPLLAFFDAALNFLLCLSILAVAVLLLGVILNSNAPLVMAQISGITARILSR